MAYLRNNGKRMRQKQDQVPAIGIDFGTTNSTVARALGKSQVELVSFPTIAGETFSSRSVLYLEKRGGSAKTHTWTGPVAIERYLAAENKGRLIQSLKSYLADRSLTGTAVFGRHCTLEDLILLLAHSLPIISQVSRLSATLLVTD